MSQLPRSVPADGPLVTIPPEAFVLRPAQHSDLGQTNEIISAAMNTWQLSERVKRLSLPLYQYRLQDFDHMDIVVAETGEHELLGVATLETASVPDAVHGLYSVLLHGIYVAPRRIGHGIGSRLLESVRSIARAKNFEGLLVKANPESTWFFETHGFQKLPMEDQLRDYPYRYWKTF